MLAWSDFIAFSLTTTLFKKEKERRKQVYLVYNLRTIIPGKGNTTSGVQSRDKQMQPRYLLACIQQAPSTLRQA